MMSVMMYAVSVAAILIFALIVVLMFSPKARGKWMSKSIMATKYMMDDSKDDINYISTNMADAIKDGVEITDQAIKNGLTEEESIYCKHCGSKIDEDSKFCKNCGKEQ